jgi:hypothetical protein
MLYVSGSTLQKKWKSLRDNCMREAKKCKSIKTGSGASKKSTYIHLKRLRFLYTLIGQKDTASNFSTEDEGLDRSTSAETNSTFRVYKGKQHKKSTHTPS